MHSRHALQFHDVALLLGMIAISMPAAVLRAGTFASFWLYFGVSLLPPVLPLAGAAVCYWKRRAFHARVLVWGSLVLVSLCQWWLISKTSSPQVGDYAFPFSDFVVYAASVAALEIGLALVLFFVWLDASISRSDP